MARCSHLQHKAVGGLISHSVVAALVSSSVLQLRGWPHGSWVLENLDGVPVRRSEIVTCPEKAV